MVVSVESKGVHRATSGRGKRERGREGMIEQSHLKVITLLIRGLINLFIFLSTWTGESQYLLSDAFKDLKEGRSY